MRYSPLLGIFVAGLLFLSSHLAEANAFCVDDEGCGGGFVCADCCGSKHCTSLTPAPPTQCPCAPPPTPTPTPLLVCVGDCNGDGRVAISEIVLGLNKMLRPIEDFQCDALDANLDGSISINEVIAAVRAALEGCLH